MPYRRRSRVGHEAALPARGGERRRNRRVRPHAGGARESRRSVELAAAEQADQPHAPRRRREDRARFGRRAGRAHLDAASCRRSRRRHQRGSGAAGGGEAGRRASGWPAPADAQPVQQHGARSARRLQPARRSVPAGGLRRRLQESDADAKHPAGAGRRIQHRCRAHCAERVPRGRCQRPRSLPAFAKLRRVSPKLGCNRPSGGGHTGARREMPRSVRARVWREGIPASVERVEIRRYNDLFAEQASRTGKFLEGARVVVEAMLQSPKFLFHVTAGEVGRPARLRDREPVVIPLVGHDARSRAS